MVQMNGAAHLNGAAKFEFGEYFESVVAAVRKWQDEERTHSRDPMPPSLKRRAVDAIRLGHKSGLSDVEMSKRFRVHGTTIGQWRLGDRQNRSAPEASSSTMSESEFEKQLAATAALRKEWADKERKFAQQPYPQSLKTLIAEAAKTGGALGWDDNRIAAALGVDHQTIRLYRTGWRKIRKNGASAIVDERGIPVAPRGKLAKRLLATQKRLETRQKNAAAKLRLRPRGNETPRDEWAMEVDALKIVVEAVAPLSPESRANVLAYVNNRFQPKDT